MNRVLCVNVYVIKTRSPETIVNKGNPDIHCGV
jgi:hypothetical protein